MSDLFLFSLAKMPGSSRSFPAQAVWLVLMISVGFPVLFT